MRNLTLRDVAEESFIYAINPNPGSRDKKRGIRPAADFHAFGLGIDIIGGTYVPPKMPASAFEDKEDTEGDDEVTFRLFDRAEGCYREVPLSDRAGDCYRARCWSSSG